MWLWIVLVVLAVMATALAYVCSVCRFEQRGTLAGGSPA